MRKPHEDWVQLRWWDAALIVALAASIVTVGWAERYAPSPEPPPACADDAPPCEKGSNGECGCVPDFPPCSMPCSGCCAGGCKAPPPNPAAHEGKH